MKTFISAIVSLFVLIAVIATVAGYILWARLPDKVSSHFSKELKVPVTIDSFGLSWGEVDAKNIAIGNPPGSILTKAFSCREVDVLAPFLNYTKKRIIIDEIDVRDIYLGLEFDSASGTSGNWTRIMSNLQENPENPPGKKSKRKSRKSEAPAPSPSESGRSVLIHRIVLTNIDVDVVYRKEGGKIKRLPRIPRMELKEISSEGGLPMDQILNSVLGQMLKEVFIKQNLNNMIQEFMNTPSPIQEYIAPFKGFFNATPQITEEDYTETI